MPPIEQSIKTIHNEDQLFSLQRLWQELKWSAFIFCFGWCEAFLRTSKNIQRNDSLPGVSRKWSAGASGFPLACWLITLVQTMEFLKDWETHNQAIFLKCGKTRCFLWNYLARKKQFAGDITKRTIIFHWLWNLKVFNALHHCFMELQIN